MTATHRICILRHNGYPQDVRVFKEARALREQGWDVDVICRRRTGQPAHEVLDGVNVRRILGQQQRGGLLRYALEYTLTFCFMSTLLSARSLRRPYDVVQVNTLPDALVFATLFARLRGSRILLDLHEPCPEMVMTRFGLPSRHKLVRFIAWLEQRSIRFAHHALAVNETIRQRYIERGAPPDKLSVVRNVPDPSFLDSAEPGAPRDGFVLSLHGSVEHRYGHETVLRALPRLRGEIAGLRLLITGLGSTVEALKEKASELGCADLVDWAGRVPFEEMARHLSGVHLGLVPLLPNPFSELCQPNKLFEYMALGIPVVASRLPALEESFSDREICYFEAGKAEDLAGQVLSLYRDPERARRIAEAAALRYQALSWEACSRHYVHVVDQTGRRHAS